MPKRRHSRPFCQQALVAGAGETRAWTLSGVGLLRFAGVRGTGSLGPPDNPISVPGGACGIAKAARHMQARIKVSCY
ncbi:uncharacterized protein BDZ83DRAFT_295057 [Colletotrichum acutatum]|uniref:Uncharacterized protein n=1 Tax=Glomerella acutata TaxID=27357 RepID=A0AAD8XPH2_GLOAC|nr:uncharacterized protein BDZ83DRAFT_295057 [Colletotrichum acutatum]KAK1731043.1 hypothetical protein BDZ83DRAFT_295057 [Colletotrichum acutatum]